MTLEKKFLKSFEPTLNESHDHVVDFAIRHAILSFLTLPPTTGPFQQTSKQPQCLRQQR